jgi:hypothetical protein
MFAKKTLIESDLFVNHNFEIKRVTHGRACLDTCTCIHQCSQIIQGCQVKKY